MDRLFSLSFIVLVVKKKGGVGVGGRLGGFGLNFGIVSYSN